MTHRDDFIAWCNDTSEPTAKSDMLPAGARHPGARPQLIGDYKPREPIDVRLLEPVLADAYPGTTWGVRRYLTRNTIALFVMRGESRVLGSVPDHWDDKRVLKAIGVEVERMFAELGSGLEVVATGSAQGR